MNIFAPVVILSLNYSVPYPNQGKLFFALIAIRVLSEFPPLLAPSRKALREYLLLLVEAPLAAHARLPVVLLAKASTHA